MVLLAAACMAQGCSSCSSWLELRWPQWCCRPAFVLSFVASLVSQVEALQVTTSTTPTSSLWSAGGAGQEAETNQPHRAEFPGGTVSLRADGLPQGALLGHPCPTHCRPTQCLPSRRHDDPECLHTLPKVPGWVGGTFAGVGTAAAKALAQGHFAMA